MTEFQRVFFAAFLGGAVSSALLIAPSSIHRLGWRVADKGRIVRVSNRLAIAGLHTLALSIVSVVLLVSDSILGRTPGIVTTACVGAVLVGAWYVLALALRRRG